MKRTITMLCALACLGASIAQETPKPPEPATQIKDLAWMLGTWNGMLTWNMPNVQTTEAKFTLTVISDNHFLRATTASEVNGDRMTETSYIGWDPAKKKYSMHTFASYAGTPRVEWGVWSKGILTWTGDPWTVDGHRTVTRTTIDKRGENNLTMSVEFMLDGKWQKVAEGLLTKKL